MRNRLPVFFALVSVLFSAPALSAEVNPLYEKLSRQSQVKVYVATPTDVSEKKALEPAALKAALEKAFTERKSIHFKVVPAAEEAEYVLDTEVKGFTFSESDPVDMLMGAAAIALDTATIDHYGTTETTFTLKDAKAGRTVWTDTLRASVTDHTMTEAESHVKVSEKLGEMLMRTAFGKKKG